MSIQYDIGKILKEYSSTVEYLWEIGDFFLLSQTVNHAVTSPEFLFADAKWRLAMWPNGTEETEGWTELWLLKSDSKDLKLQVRWELGIKCDDGATYKSHCGEQELEGNFARCGEIRLLRHSELFEMRDVVAPCGILTVFCGLRLKEKICVTESHKSAEKLIHDLEGLLFSGNGSDVTIEVDHEQFKAHRVILAARSPVFATMFEPPWTEKDTGEVNIKDCDKDVFREFLHYVYTGKLLELTPGNVCSLYTMGERYLMDELKVECVEGMKNILNIDNFCDVLSSAVLHSEAELLELAKNFFSRNELEIQKTVKWQKFRTHNYRIAKEAYRY